MRGQINDHAAQTLSKGQVLWDYSELGFGLRNQGGLTVFFVRYRQNGMRRHLTLGRQPEMSAAEARARAKVILDAANNRTKPELQWQIPRSKSGTTYFGEIAERYLKDHAKPRKKPSSLISDRRNLELHILPALGRLRLRHIDRARIAAMHANLHLKPVAANRCLALVSHIYSVAAKWGLIEEGANPCHGIDRFREKPRDRYLTDDELERLGEALRVARNGYSGLNWANYSVPEKYRRTTREDWRSLAAIEMLLLTGARMTEVITLRWEWIDKKLGIARLPDSKSGPKLLYLPQHALWLLERIKKSASREDTASPFVFPGNRAKTSFQGLFHPWRRIRAIAGLHELRIHDLRHVYASTSVSNGDSLYIVGRILGHKQFSTTERYAHLAIGPVREVANRTASKLAQFL